MGHENTILVVDDDEKIRKLLRRCLEADGHRVLEAFDAAGVDQQLEQHHVDLITLDLQLGRDNGLTIAASLRNRTNIPIVMVTGKGDVIDKVVGLEVGADDYITKPFHIREVQARIRAMLRRFEGINNQEPTAQALPVSGIESEIYTFLGWKADPSRMLLLSPQGEECELTTTDFKLLMIFLNAPKRVLSRDQIMDKLSGLDWTPYDRTVDNQVARLRKKIEPHPTQPKIIKTVRGVGYLFAADVDRTMEAAGTEHPPNP